MVFVELEGVEPIQIQFDFRYFMAALEKASVQGDITDFTLFIASLIPAIS